MQNTEGAYRCYAASEEARFSSVRKSRWNNYQALIEAEMQGGMAQVVKLLLHNLHPKAGTVRVHASGDFYSQTYFDAWMTVAEMRPQTTFYAYTKSLPFWMHWLEKHGHLPDNFRLTASTGGKFDYLIEKYRLNKVIVVYHPEEAEAAGLLVDHDDSLALRNEETFALLVHGTQPAGSPASKAQQRMRKEGVNFGYSK